MSSKPRFISDRIWVLVVGVITVVLSVTLTQFFSQRDIQERINREMRQGGIIFDDIGVTYFYSLSDFVDKNTKKFHNGTAQSMYFENLTDMRRNLDLLRENAFFDKIKNKINLPIVRANISKEISDKHHSPQAPLLDSMCGAFFNNTDWEISIKEYNEHANDIINNVRFICKANAD